MRKQKKDRWKEAQNAEAIFWKFQKKKGVLLPAESKERYKKCLELLPVSINHLTRILDVGSGPYGGISLFIPKSCLVVSLDPLIEKKSFRHNNEIINKVNAVRAVGECLPIKQNVFDIIFCVNALDHSFEPSRILNEINRVLRRNGVFIMMVHVVGRKEKIVHNLIYETLFRRVAFIINHLRHFRPVDKIYATLTALAFGSLDILNDSILHPFYFVLNDVVTLLSQAGFNIFNIKLCQSPWNYKKDLFIIAYKCQTNNHI